MISERNAIEHQYAEKLRAWTTKWVQTVQAGRCNICFSQVLIGAWSMAKPYA